MNRIHEKAHFEEMPPKKKDQPSEAERKQLEDWLAGILHANNASKLADKLRMPDYGNKVDHDKLFSGKYKNLPGYTADRRWLISEFIFNAKMNKLLEHTPQFTIDGKRQPVIGSNNRGATRVNLSSSLPPILHYGIASHPTLAIITSAVPKPSPSWVNTLRKRILRW